MRVPSWIEDAASWLRWDLPEKLGKAARAVGGGLGRVVPGLGRVPRRAWLIGAGALALVAALVWVIASGALSSDSEPRAETRVVTVAVQTDDAEDAPVGTLGFPLVATRNTTRVGGADPTADAAAVALATHPITAGGEPIEAAVLVGEDDWQAGIAASVLVGPPLRAPLLIGAAGEVPESTQDALAALDPRGGSGPDDAAVYAVGQVATPPGLATLDLDGDSPAELADAIARLRQRLLGQSPSNIVVASQDDPAFAMPAAAWAARSGDPVLFAERDQVPEPTLEALRRHPRASVYVLGGPNVISEGAMRELKRAAPGARRVGASEPIANAVQFARHADTGFGWNINDPGHGIVIANSSRPLDAAAAAALSASGSWGPLLLVEQAGTLPAEVRSFLLDIKPGFQDDPTRAVYNHIWLIGDTTAIGAAVQAELDELAEVAEVGRGPGGPITEGPGGGQFAQPRGPEDEPPQGQGGRGGGRQQGGGGGQP